MVKSAKNEELLLDPIIKKKSAPRSHVTEPIFNNQMNKKTTVLEQDASSRVVEKMPGSPLSDGRKKDWKKKMSKKDSIMFRPSQVENKILDTIVLKVSAALLKGLPEKERYRINVIPCNTNTMSKKSRQSAHKSKSVEELPDGKEEKVVPNKASQFNLHSEHIEQFTKRNLEIIALKTKAITRRMTKFQSTRKLLGYIDLKISPESFISENTSKFSDYYRILSSIGQGGYGQVFKVQHKNSGLIRAMKSNFILISVIARSKVDKKNHGKMLFEFQLLKGIDHPNILRIYEIFKDDKNFYLITE